MCCQSHGWIRLITPQTKPHWQKHRSFEDKPHFEESITKQALPKSPIRVSTQSKSKLSAFQYGGSRQSSPKKSPDKENEPIQTNGIAADIDKLSSSPIKDGVKLTVESPSVTHKAIPPPSTPAMRLPLADLIGNAEDALRRPPPKEQSPEEQLGWIPNSSNSALTPGQRRKRAHSSSPLSSQQDTSTHFALKEPLDLQTLQQSLKTPHADPAADLWSRYATNRNTDETPLEVKLPSLAHLLEDSSPHSLPRTPGGSVGGLRRWASCGIEWPASKPKRRKVHGVLRDQDDIFTSGSRQGKSMPSTKISRVGMLVDQVQATLAQPIEKSKKDGPSSSSPLPDKGHFAADRVNPSIHKQEACDDDHYGSQEQQQRGSQADVSHSKQSAGQSQSTQYGDDDLDLEAVTSVDHVEHTNVHDASNQSESIRIPRFEYQDILPSESASQQQTVVNSHHPTLNVQELETVPEDDEEDEFADDCDITAEDLENAMTMFDQEPLPNLPQHPRYHATQDARFQYLPEAKLPPNGDLGPMISAAVVEDESDNEEFGGSDLDDEQFAAAEVAATQAYHASATTQSSVRISNLPRK